MTRGPAAVFLVLAWLVGCDGRGVAILGPEGAAGSAGAPAVVPTGASRAAQLAAELGRPGRFLVGMGNDLPEDGLWENATVHNLGVQLDLHYVFLTGLAGQGGWPDWNPGGWYPVVVGNVDAQRGVTPVFTVLTLNGRGEGDLTVLTDADYMAAHWSGAELLLTRLGTDFDAPAIIHLEPNFWGEVEVAAPTDPTTIPAILHASCSTLPADATGIGRCWLALARELAPKVRVGFHVSRWPAEEPADIVAYLRLLGAAEADLAVVETLNRDAGCFEAAAPECTGEGTYYWDATNQTSPNFREHLEFCRSVADGLALPLLWWQLPFGVPSETPGGTPGHYRDNRVAYLFAHPDEFVAVGGLGAVFGVAATNQTYPGTDGGQFVDAVTAYLAAPTPLP